MSADHIVHFMDLRRRTGYRLSNGHVISQTPVICALDIVEFDQPPFTHDVTYVPDKATCVDCRARIEAAS